MFAEQIEKYFTFEHFMCFYRKASSSEEKKKKRIDMFAFYQKLKISLELGTYLPLPYRCFYVKEPNIREVFSPSFEDRIIHHLLVSILYPIEKSFIEDSYANREKKGTHKAVERLQYFMRKIPQKDCYFMQCDIENYFMSINKYILFKIIFKQMSLLNLSGFDRNFLVFLLNKIILQDVTKNAIVSKDGKISIAMPKHKSLFNQEKHKGIPIGAYSSQFESLLYLNELDWFVKKELNISYYIRYVDDFIIIHDNQKDFNKIKEQIETFLREALELKLHPKKIVIQNVSKGANFLGYIVRPHYILVRKRTVNSLKDKLRFFNWLIFPNDYEANKVKKYYDKNSVAKSYRNGFIKEGEPLSLLTLVSMLQTINSYYGIFTKANSYKLRVYIYENHFKALKKFFLPKESSLRAFILNPYFIQEYAKGNLIK